MKLKKRNSRYVPPTEILQNWKSAMIKAYCPKSKIPIKSVEALSKENHAMNKK